MIDWIKYTKGDPLPPVGTDVLVSMIDRTVENPDQEICTGYVDETGSGFMCEGPFDFHYHVITHYAIPNVPRQDTWVPFQTVEVGRTYRTRNGCVVEITSHSGNPNKPFKTSYCASYRADGRYYGADDSCQDLMEVRLNAINQGTKP